MNDGDKNYVISKDRNTLKALLLSVRSKSGLLFPDFFILFPFLLSFPHHLSFPPHQLG